MCKHTTAEMGKSGQIQDTKPKTGQMGVFPGHIVKNRDCHRKPGTDVYLSWLGD